MSIFPKWGEFCAPFRVNDAGTMDTEQAEIRAKTGILQNYITLLLYCRLRNAECINQGLLLTARLYVLSQYVMKCLGGTSQQKKLPLQNKTSSRQEWDEGERETSMIRWCQSKFSADYRAAEDVTAHWARSIAHHSPSFVEANLPPGRLESGGQQWRSS